MIPRLRLRLPAIGLGALVVAVAGFVALAAGQNAPPSYALTNCQVDDLTMDSQELAFLNLLNDYRQENGLQPLTVSTNLNRAASWMAQDLGEQDYFSHTDSLGRSPSSRAQQCDFPGSAGENIAAGTYRDSAQDAFEMWRESAGHNANMLGEHYQMVGIARYYAPDSTYGWYWVTSFAAVDDGTDLLAGDDSADAATASPTNTAAPANSTPTPTPEPEIAAAELTSPEAGSLLSYRETLRWTSPDGAEEYFLYVGTTPGGNQLFGRSMGEATGVTLYGFPQDGRTLYFRLWTRTAEGWSYNDYVFQTEN